MTIEIALQCFPFVMLMLAYIFIRPTSEKDEIE